MLLVGLIPKSLIFFIDSNNNNAKLVSPLLIRNGALTSFNDDGKYGHPNTSAIVLIVKRILPNDIDNNDINNNDIDNNDYNDMNIYNIVITYRYKIFFSKFCCNITIIIIIIIN